MTFMLVGNYYSVSINVANTNGAGYYSFSLDAGELDGGALQIMPTAASAIFATITGHGFQFEAPPAKSIAAGTTVVTSDSTVSGTIGVSPASAADVVVKLFGAAKLLGTYTLPAGETSGRFSFPVSAEDAVPHAQKNAFFEEIRNASRTS
jgi:hypothetical protein